jgi:hypothetical protein
LNRYNGSHVTANLLGQSIPLWLEQARARSTVKIQIASDLGKKIGLPIKGGRFINNNYLPRISVALSQAKR